ncbi:hypothetical protein FRC04_003810 [Tulasnella sp. 424]|nr:hypothetical protein FRC04_003810 [Tulasnella sp. 424]KAG8973693.1 hypothetical protein FRC05_008281 [Tulasnella sp. 425]
MEPHIRDPKLWTSCRPTSAAPLDTTDDENLDLPPRPLPNSYWATPTLLASECPGDSREHIATPKLKALLDAGITDFFDLMEEWESLTYLPTLERLVSERGGHVVKLDTSKENDSTFFQDTPQNGDEGTLLVRYARFPIQDGSVPTSDALQVIMNALHVVQQQHNRKAVVHCWGGIGRTGTIVGCWLVYSGAVKDEEVASVVAKAQSSSPSAPTLGRTVQDEEPRGDAEGVEGPSHVPAKSRVRLAGDLALEVLEKKWKGVDKSWKAPRTPENVTQEDMVRSFRPLRLTTVPAS